LAEFFLRGSFLHAQTSLFASLILRRLAR
jgi:hypothetical protein